VFKAALRLTTGDEKITASKPERARHPTTLRSQQERAWLPERQKSHDGICDLGGYAVAVPSHAVGAITVEIHPHRVEPDAVMCGQHRTSVL
jgi:hypothetical protein